MRPIESQPWRIESFAVQVVPRALMSTVLWDDGVAIAAISNYAIKRIQEGVSDEAIIKDLRAIGRLYTFALSKLESTSSRLSSRELLQAYVLLRLDGSVERDTWADPLALYWQPASWGQVHNELIAIERFFKFVNNEGISDHDERRQRVNEILGRYVQSASAGDIVQLMEERSMNVTPRPVANLSDGSKKRRHTCLPKMVLPEQMIELVDRGAREPRDKLLLLLMGYGSCRTSEPPHLYVCDVEERFAGTGATRVRFPHPATSMFRWRDGQRARYGTRRQYLWAVYGRYPRNELGISHPEFSGWKGMTFQTRDPNEQYAVWVEEKFAGCYFQSLLQQYFKDHAGLFLSGRLQHPYLFVNTDRRKSAQNYGAPLRKENVRSIFYRAAARIGIEAHPHMARHHSGYYLANIANTNLELARQILRHAHPQSTSVYFSKHPDAVRRQLQGLLSPEDEPFEPTIQFTRPAFPTYWS